MAISAKVFQDGVDVINVANIFGSMPSYDAPEGVIMETQNALPLSDSEYSAATHDVIRINGGSAITIEDGDNVYRVLFTEDSTFLPQECLDSTTILTRGSDYYVYLAVIDNEVSIVVSSNATVPSGAGFTVSNTRKIGGFHYSNVRVVSQNGVPIDSTGEEWGTSGTSWKDNVITNMVVPNSVWDLSDTVGGRYTHDDGLVAIGGSWSGDDTSGPTGKYDRRQMRFWASIYLASLRSGEFTFSSGSSLNPLGGTWEVGSYFNSTPITGTEGLAGFNFIEIAQRKGMRLPSYEEWCQLAFGNPGGEASANNYGYTSGSSRAPTGCSVTVSSAVVKPYAISAWNCVDCVGNVWEWLADIFHENRGSTSWSYRDVLGTEVGQVYAASTYNPGMATAGGGWSRGSCCGPRALALDYYAWGVHTNDGARFLRDVSA